MSSALRSYISSRYQAELASAGLNFAPDDRMTNNRPTANRKEYLRITPTFSYMPSDSIA